MITRNFKRLASFLLQVSPLVAGCYPLTDVNGAVFFSTGSRYESASPAGYTINFFPPTEATLYDYGYGISVGSGTTPAKETDYQLEHTITSGIALSIADTTTFSEGLYTQGVLYKISVTNTGSSDVTISEIGYKGRVLTGFPNCVGTYADESLNVLFDRTVLNPPIVIAPGNAAMIDYQLKTELEETKIVSGVKMVSWTFGTDEEIAAMLDAAEQGLIDLQEDGGWKIGEMRKINVGAWTDGAGNAQAAISHYIAISSFEDYMSCGCVMQFDFLTVPASQCRMNNASAANYSTSEMYTTTLPALVEALPEWLKTRLKTFDVEVYNAAGSGATKIVVSNNKLALRSEYEIMGRTTLGHGPEGASQIPAYFNSDVSSVLKCSVKNFAHSLGSQSVYWTRTPSVTSGYAAFSTEGVPWRYNTANTPYGYAPFGCI